MYMCAAQGYTWSVNTIFRMLTPPPPTHTCVLQAVALAHFAHFLDLSDPRIRQQLTHYAPDTFDTDRFGQSDAACALLQKRWRGWLVRSQMARRHRAARRLQLLVRAHVAFRDMCRPNPFLGLPLVREAHRHTSADKADKDEGEGDNTGTQGRVCVAHTFC